MQVDSFVLVNVENKQVVGITPSVTAPDQVLVTVQSQGVYLYDTTDQKCKESWLIAPGTTFSHQALFNPATKKLYAVQDKTRLVSWTDQTHDLKKLARKSFDSEIHSLYMDKILGSHVLLLFANGTLGLCQSDMNQIHTAGAPKTGAVIWSLCKRVDSLLFFFVVTLGSDKRYVFSVFTVLRDQNKDFNLAFQVSHTLTKPTDKSTLTTCCFDADTFALTVFWSEGTLEFWKFGSASDMTRVADSAKLTCRRKLNCMKQKKSDGSGAPIKGVHALVLQPSVVLLAGPSSKTSYTFITWDSNYGTVQGSKDFTATAGEVEIQQLRPSEDHKLLLLSMAHQVVVCPVWVSLPSLASVIGSMAATEKFLEAESINSSPAVHFELDTSLPVPTAKPEGTGLVPLPSSAWDHLIDPARDNEVSLLNDLLDKSKTSSTDAFMKLFQEYIALRTVQRKQDASTTGPQRTKKWKNLQDYSENAQKSQNKQDLQEMAKLPSSRLSPEFIYKVGLRCLQDSMWEPLAVILESKMTSAKSLPTLMPTLLEKKQIDVLLASLLYVSDISEREVISALRLVLATQTQALRTAMTNLRKSATITTAFIGGSEQTPLDQVLNIILSRPFNTIFMLQSARRIPVKEVTIILQFLHRWLQYYKEHNSTNELLKTNFRVPSFDQIVTWCNVMIDSHMPELILVEECKDLVLKIGEDVAQHLKICEQLQMLRGCLIHYMHHDPTPRNNSNSEYSIETFNL